MKQYALFLGVVVSSFCAFAKVESKVVLNERFETDIDYSSIFKIEDNCKISFVKGKDAISGEGSILLDTLNDKAEWPIMMRYPAIGSLEDGKIYKVTFKYKAVADSLTSGKTGYVYANAHDGDKSFRVGTMTYDITKGAKDTVVFSFIIKKKWTNATLSFSTHKGGSVMIDNLKIESIDFPETSNWILEKKSFMGMRKSPIEAGYFDIKLGFYNMQKNEFYPFIDKYGQFKHRNWKGKIKKDSDFQKRIVAEAKFEQSLPKIKRDKFGGYISDKYKFEATGRFYPKKVEGKWYLISPEGNLFWSQGVDCVGAHQGTPISDREFYFEDVTGKKYIGEQERGMFDYAGRVFKTFTFTRRNMDIKYGADDMGTYRPIVERRFKTWGLNTCGAWSTVDLLEGITVPYTVYASSSMKMVLESKKKLVEYWRKFPDYFDPNFEKGTMARMRAYKTLMDSPYCVGVFVDNELPWQNNPLDTPKAVLATASTQPTKIAFKDFLQKKYNNISKLNGAWDSSYSDWDAFLSTDDFVPKTKEGEADMLAFERKIYERYFSVCRAAVKAVSPNVLYLGCRLAWTNPIVAQVSSEYCDVVSYNLYRNNVAGFKLPEGSQDKPVIIGEYHFGDQSRGVFGGGLRPRKNAKEQAEAYIDYTESAIENPIVVGAHWFQWFDQPTTGRFDGENYAIGLVDICDTPNYELVKAVANVASRLYELRTGVKGETRKENTEKTTTY